MLCTSAAIRGVCRRLESHSWHRALPSGMRTVGADPGKGKLSEPET